jgi:hypothetical protein
MEEDWASLCTNISTRYCGDNNQIRLKSQLLSPLIMSKKS